MIKNILTHIGGIENYGIISLCLFFVFFTGMLIWVFTLKKSFLAEMACVPLEQQPLEHHDDHDTCCKRLFGKCNGCCKRSDGSRFLPQSRSAEHRSASGSPTAPGRAMLGAPDTNN
jgi:cytochrome c oxidase cbb3-type subunit 4